MGGKLWIVVVVGLRLQKRKKERREEGANRVWVGDLGNFVVGDLFVAKNQIFFLKRKHKVRIEISFER